MFNKYQQYINLKKKCISASQKKRVPIPHSYNTRHRLRSHYELGTPKSDIGKSSVKFFGVKIWGELGKDLQDAASLDVFKNMYKKALFEQ